MPCTTTGPVTICVIEEGGIVGAGKRLAQAMLFGLSIFVFLNYGIFRIPSIVRAMREVASGLPVSPGGPPPGFLPYWLATTAIAGFVAWLTGRSLFRRNTTDRQSDNSTTSAGN